MCPRCNSLEVTRSRSRFRDTVMLWMGMKPYRCRECNKRFHVPAKLDRNLRREKARQKTTQRRGREVPVPEGIDSVG